VIILLFVPLVSAWPVTSGWLTTNPLPWSGIATATGHIIGLTTLDPNDGITTQALGRLAARQWLGGHVPWWNPYSGIGLPLSAEGQNPALFVPFVFLLLLHNGPFLLKLVLEEIAGVSTFLLLRTIGLTPLAALAGGALFSINGTFAWFGHGPVMPIAFLPLTLLGVENSFRMASASGTPPIWASWPVTAVSIALSLYAAFPETTYIDFLLVLAWALVRLGQCSRSTIRIFFKHLALAAIVGVLLSAPFIVPFLTLVHLGNVGMHARDIGNLYIPRSGLPLILAPTLYGPLGTILRGNPTSADSWLWAFMGGYISLPVLCCALLALGGKGRAYKALRWTLACWSIAMIGASFGAPFLAKAVYAIPLLKQTQVFRYSPPSWEFAFSVLAAFAVDDFQRFSHRSRYTVLVVASIGCLALILSYLYAQPIRVLIRQSPIGHPNWFANSLIAYALVAGIILLIVFVKPRRWGAALIVSLIVGQAAVIYSVPLLSGARKETKITGGISYLQQHIGLSRFYTLGPIRPNYSAYYGISSINSDYLPAPSLWTSYIVAALDPTTDPLAFSGQSQIPGVPIPNHAGELRKNIKAYQDLGVRYVVSSPGTDPLDDVLPNQVIQPAEGTRFLTSSGSYETVLTPAEFKPGTLDSVAIQLGTFGGKSRGILHIKACSSGVCAEGGGNLLLAPDDSLFQIALNKPLILTSQSALILHISKSDQSRVAIWLYRNQITHRTVPSLELVYASHGVPHQRVYQDSIMAIDEIGGAAPLMGTTTPVCALAKMTRSSVVATCTEPSTLIRRVLAYPGWSARENDKTVAVAEFPPIFQAIPVSKGINRVDFHYNPPFFLATMSAFWVGVVLLLFGCLNSNVLKLVMVRAKACDPQPWS
jgi:hypothetical protein